MRRSRPSAQSIRRGQVAYGGRRHRCASLRSRAGMTPPPACISLNFRKRALRAAGRSMETTPSSWASHYNTVNLLSKLRSSSLFGIGRSRPAAPRASLERSHWRRLPLAMGGCFPFFVAHESIRRRHVACHWNASRSLPPSHRAAAQHGWPAHEVHIGRDELSVCDRSRGALRFVVLLCSCPSRRWW